VWRLQFFLELHWKIRKTIMAQNAERAVKNLLQGFLQLYPSDAARLLDSRPIPEIVRLLEAEPAPRAAAVFERLTAEVAAQVLGQMARQSACQILARLDPSRVAPLLARLDEKARTELLDLMEPAAAKELHALMIYPPHSAGHMMDPRATTFRPDATVREALGRIRALPHRRIHDVYLVDEEGRLVGAVALQELALAAPAERLEGLARRAPASVQAMAGREELVDLLTQLRLPSLPVVDVEGRLLGVIRHEALITAAQEEASADIQTMVGASKEERALSSVSFAVRKRLPWLQINLVTAFVAAAVVGLFEGIIARFTALAVLLPVVAGQSGNTGAQALAVTMRGLALREIRPRHWLRISVKEINVAFLNGLAVALTTSLGVYVWSRSVGLALVIGLSMVISMVAAGLSGAAVPMILIALGQDPAQSSSIVLTTVTDVVGFFSFLGIATLLAGMLQA
jgi:magnesium transporter